MVSRSFMENVVFNKCQTPIEDLHLEKYPQEVQENFWDFLNNVPFIKWMVSPDRPYVHELPKDENGRVIIDVTKPPILENTSYFRQTAKVWEDTGRYTSLRPNRNPNSDFGKWLREERRRGWEGYTDPSTGMWVTGDYYWMLNYCPMHLVEKRKDGLEVRVVKHPKFWDGQFLMSHYFYQARQHGHHAAELASRGKGKAHPYSQIVYTPEGVKQWGDIEVGDALFGDDGNITHVTMIPFDEEEKIYTVTLSDGRSLKCTSGHLFYVKDNRKHPSMRVVSLYDIMHSDYAHRRRDGGIEYYYAIPNNKKVEFNAQRTLIEPYTLGLLLGDGALTKTTVNTVEFTSSEEDIETYRQHVPYEIVCRKAKYSHAININGIRDFLHEYGLYECTSDKKFIPKEYMFNTSEVRLELLRGILDTDGTVNNNGVPMLTTTSKRLAEDVRWLCHSLGYNSTMFTKQGKYKDDMGIVHICKNTYNVTILTNAPVFKLERKLQRLGEFTSAYSRSRKDWTRIVDIKYSHREKAKCVIVDNESHCYLIGDFIVTHNTSLGAAMLAKRFIIGEFANNREKVQCIVTAADNKKLIGTNQILSVFVDNIDFCAKNTQFASRRLKSSKQELAWKMGYKKKGSDVEYGSSNEVMGFTSGVDQDKLNGTRGVLYLVEEAGIFKDLLNMYNMIRPSVEQGSSVFGEVCLYGTAGDTESDFTSFAEMIYSPNGYNMEPLENVYDKEGQGRKQSTIFYGAYMNYDDSCMDENGNSDVTKALLALCYDRYKVKYGSTDINTVTKRISQYPIVPQEAIIRSQGNMFPVTELNERLNQLDNNPSEYDDVYIGELTMKGGEVKFTPTADIPIREYPLKDNNTKGALEIFEMPQKNAEGKVPQGRYILSLDPYYNDTANTTSLGSVFVMDLWTDRIVADYIGRPAFAEDLYELVRKMCLFYNGKVMYENNVKGPFSYFSKYNCIYLLAETPEYLIDKQLIGVRGYGNTAYGVRATTPIINYGFRIIRDWLLKPVNRIEKDEAGNDMEVTVPNLYNIRCRELLKELILWNPNGNYDAIMSLVQLMLYREEKMILFQGNVRRDDTGSSGLEDDEFFTKNYRGKPSERVKIAL